MSEILEKNEKLAIMKDIILKLHSGLSLDEAKNRFEAEIGEVNANEIAEMEQQLIDQGVTPEQIKEFCNVHALLFQKALVNIVSEETSPSHPVNLFKLENREIEKITADLKTTMEVKNEQIFDEEKIRLTRLLEKLQNINKHYERKEQILFPFLEKYGFMGPSKVMWGKHNEIRELLKTAKNELPGVKTAAGLETYKTTHLYPMIEEIEGMIFKEENVLFPASLEKLTTDDWINVLKESEDIGYAYIKPSSDIDAIVKELSNAMTEEPVISEEKVRFPSGTLGTRELMSILDSIPLDLTFVGSDDTVKYFSQGRERAFRRTRSVIGRNVQNCHPPQSIDVVNKIMASLKNGSRDHYDFWINIKGKMVYIKFIAIRDRENNYLGTLEVTQDISEIRQLEGEKRLIDERD